jgi:hypothetical protein
MLELASGRSGHLADCDTANEHVRRRVEGDQCASVRTGIQKAIQKDQSESGYPWLTRVACAMSNEGICTVFSFLVAVNVLLQCTRDQSGQDAHQQIVE